MCLQGILQQSNETQVRNSSIELLRILCMLMIVGEHLASYHCKGVDGVSDIPYTDVFRNFCVCSVNTFVLISGYFGIKFKLNKLLRLCNKTWFYSVFGLLISVFLGMHVFSPKTDFLVFFPVFSRQYWFITVYVVLYLLSPFINRFVDLFAKETLQKILILGGILFYVWPTLCWLVNAPQLIPDAGYGIVNFVYLYILGRYIHIHYQINRNKLIPMILYLLSCIVLYFSQFVISSLLGFRFTSFISYNTVFCLFASLGLFLLFLKINLKVSAINCFAKRCLAVYFIHVFMVLKPFYIDVLENIHGIWLFLVIPLLSATIYLFCIFVDFVRDCIFSKIDDYFLSFIEKKLRLFYNFICNKICKMF